MKPTVEQITNLLALRRGERPDEGYWQDFLCEFHRNQRELAVKKQGRTGFFDCVSGWFADLGPSKWAYVAGTAYAVVTVAFLLTPRKVVKEAAPVSPVNYEVVPAPVPPQTEAPKPLDLNLPVEGNAGGQAF